MIQIENMLTQNEWGKLLDDEYINGLDKNANYSFLEKCVVHEEEDVRNLTLTFCQRLMPANALKVFSSGLKDENDQNVNRAAWGIYELNPSEQKSEILDEIKKMVPKFREGISPAFVKMVLSIGKIGTLDDLKDLSKIIVPLNKDDINEAFLWAFAKTGDSLSIERIKFILKAGTLQEKERILEGVKYISNKDLIEDVSKLLLDERIVEIEYRGDSDRILYQVRLCDRAISTLLNIDDENNVVEYFDLDTYSDDDLEKMRKYYSITKS